MVFLPYIPHHLIIWKLSDPMLRIVVLFSVPHHLTLSDPMLLMTHAWVHYRTSGTISIFKSNGSTCISEYVYIFFSLLYDLNNERTFINWYWFSFSCCWKKFWFFREVYTYKVIMLLGAVATILLVLPLVLPSTPPPPPMILLFVPVLIMAVLIVVALMPSETPADMNLMNMVWSRSFNIQ